MRHASSIVLLSIATLLGCGGPWGAQPSGAEEPLGQPAGDDPDPQQPQIASPATAAPASGGTQAGASDRDAPEISRSRGAEGELVVFWPRVIPRTSEPAMRKLAAELQQRLVTLAGQAVAGRKLDVRPEPERVCPRDGCAAPTLGVLLVHHGGGCSALGLVSGAGKADQHIVPWAGVVDVKRSTVAFREHPESEVTIRDAVPCNKLIAGLDRHQDDVKRALAATVGH